MPNDYKENDYLWIKELLDYPAKLEESVWADSMILPQIELPDDPIDYVYFPGPRQKSHQKNCSEQRSHSHGGTTGYRKIHAGQHV